MNRRSRQSPGLFLPIASLAVAGLAIAALVGVQLGWVDSPFNAKDASPKAGARGVAKAPEEAKPGGRSKGTRTKPSKPRSGPASGPAEGEGGPSSKAEPSLAFDPPEVPKAEPPRTPARLAYEKKAEGLPGTPKAWAELARWCEENQWLDEARDAWETVIRIDPNHASARKKMGYKKMGDAWKTAAMIAEEAEQKKADKEWEPKLRMLHKRMHPGRGKDSENVARDAVADLEQVVDPRAAPMLWEVFGGHRVHHLMVAERLAKLESPRSSLLLAGIAAYTPDPKAERAAIEALKGRDPVVFASPLIALLGPELKYKRSKVPPEYGQPAMELLEIEDERFTKQFVYFAAVAPGALSSQAFGDCSAYVRWANFGWTSEGRDMAGQMNRAEAELANELARRQLEGDIAAVKDLNRQIRTRNDRVRTILAETTGADHRIDRDEWTRWLFAKMGKKYVAPEQVAKLTIRDFVQPLYQPTFITIPPAPT